MFVRPDDSDHCHGQRVSEDVQEPFASGRLSMRETEIRLLEVVGNSSTLFDE